MFSFGSIVVFTIAPLPSRLSKVFFPRDGRLATLLRDGLREDGVARGVPPAGGSVRASPLVHPFIRW